MNSELARQKYNTIYPDLVVIAERLLRFLTENLPSERIDRITTRPKSIDSFVAKSQKMDGLAVKYIDPFKSIQDQIGARIVVFYRQDVIRISSEINNLFRRIEQVEKAPEKKSEFGYEGLHYILLMPDEIKLSIMDYDRLGLPSLFELQIKTLFQHAWGEANHDLAYKAKQEMHNDFHRKIAFTAAQAWGADKIFEELFDSTILEAEEEDPNNT